jgi:hypothetical protein
VVHKQVQCVMEVGASTLEDAARVNLTLGCAMGDATIWRCGAHPWSVVRLLWLQSRRNRGNVDGGGGKLLES